jgi:hypothetical protein
MENLPANLQPAADVRGDAPPWRCPGREVMTLPHGLRAVLVRRCEAEPDSAVDLCDVCWAVRLREAS